MLVGIYQRSVTGNGKNAVTDFVEYAFKYLQLLLGGHSFRDVTTHNQNVFFIQRKNPVLVVMVRAIEIHVVMRCRNSPRGDHFLHIGMDVLIGFGRHHLAHVHSFKIFVGYPDMIGFFIGNNFNASSWLNTVSISGKEFNILTAYLS